MFIHYNNSFMHMYTVYRGGGGKCMIVSLFLTAPVRVQTSDSTMTFRGFAVQSRQSTPTFSSDANFLGSFTNAPPGGDWQLWNCPSAPVSTHLAMIT